MILVDGEKYACVQCIRGHRSSTCKHSQRPLVQVRSRGRPSLNQTHRIAVTESEIVMSRDQVNIQGPEILKEPVVKSCCSKKKETTCSSCSADTNCNNGVILLKASKRQFVDVVDGNLDFVGPYKGSSTNSFKLKKSKHIRSSSCQSQSKLKALKTLEVKLSDDNQVYNLGINHQQQQHFDFDKVLNDFNKMANPQYSNELVPNMLPPGMNHEPIAFDMFLGEGCADECDCGPTCSCPGCLIHRTNEELREYGILDSSTSVSTPTDFKSDDGFGKNVTQARNYYKKEASPEVKTPQELNFETIDELLIQEMLDDCSCEEDDCKCFNCLKHGISNGVRLKDGIKVFEMNEFLEESNHDCGCNPDECECFNCPKHGIYNGVRIGIQKTN